MSPVVDYPEHRSFCNVCRFKIWWQSSPTGGWWIHEGDKPYKARNTPEHDADPGWWPVEEEPDV